LPTISVARSSASASTSGFISRTRILAAKSDLFNSHATNSCAWPAAALGATDGRRFGGRVLGTRGARDRGEGGEGYGALTDGGGGLDLAGIRPGRRRRGLVE